MGQFQDLAELAEKLTGEAGQVDKPVEAGV